MGSRTTATTFFPFRTGRFRHISSVCPTCTSRARGGRSATHHQALSRAAHDAPSVTRCKRQSSRARGQGAEGCSHRRASCVDACESRVNASTSIMSTVELTTQVYLCGQRCVTHTTTKRASELVLTPRPWWHTHRAGPALGPRPTLAASVLACTSLHQPEHTPSSTPVLAKPCPRATPTLHCLQRCRLTGQGWWLDCGCPRRQRVRTDWVTEGANAGTSKTSSSVYVGLPAPAATTRSRSDSRAASSMLDS